MPVRGRSRAQCAKVVKEGDSRSHAERDAERDSDDRISENHGGASAPALTVYRNQHTNEKKDNS